MREKNNAVLHTACGEIRSINFNQNVLTVFIKEDYLFNILTKEQNANELERCLHQIDKDYILKIEKEIPKQNLFEISKQKLKKMFNEDLRVE